MKYLHWEIYTEEAAVVRVELDRHANVRLLDELNYLAYRSGRNHRSYDGRHPIPAAPATSTAPTIWF